MVRNSALIIVLLLLLLIRFIFPSEPQKYAVDQRVVLVNTLSSEPQISVKSQRFLIGNIEIVTGRYPEYHYGDKLKIEGIIKAKQPDTGSLSMSLLPSKKSDLMTFPKIEIIKHEEGNKFLKTVIDLRRNLVKNYQEFLPEPSASLLIGIVLGVKTPMNQDFKENLRLAGLTHVVVASGMNIALVAGFLSGFLTLFIRRRLSLILVLLGIFFYAFLAGFEAPIIRASIMGSLVILSQGIGRQSWGALSLFLAGFIMLFLNPSLIFDLGFQLSFLATAGLIFVQPSLERIRLIIALKKIPFVGEATLTTLAVQLTTLPLILATFGYYNFFSILTNGLVLWTIPWIMGIGGMAGVLGLIIKPIGQLLSWLAYPLLFYFEKVTTLSGDYFLLSFKIQELTMWFPSAYFAFLTAFLIWLRRESGGVRNKP
ncbi:ComEC/Rec2 family competence protein [Candidatus Microgenomates bacterium]|nr:ComEC/Rec2 family competence protein [Candidatus Microgenomates bacterium]